MRHLLSILLLSISAYACAQDTATIVKNTPVKVASEAKWETARSCANQLVADSTYSDSIFGGFLLMVGTGEAESGQHDPGCS
jgi:hypothetical protein